jgi:hypothetical protein
VNVPALVLPAGVTTVTAPLVALGGTTALRLVPECAVNELAATPLNLTAVAAATLLPVIVTVVPATPLDGAALAAEAVGVNVALVVAVPPGVVTLIAPVVAVVGTTAVTCVAETTWKLAAATPLNFTPDVALRLLPVIVTVVPLGPLLGVKLDAAGEATGTVKLVVLVELPPGAVTEMVPLVAPAGTVVVSDVPLVATVGVGAAVPLNLTADAPIRLVPVIVTVVPALPLLGVKLVIAGVTVKLVVLAAEPAAVVTPITPLVAVLGSVATTLVADFTVKLVAVTPLNLTAVVPERLVPVIVTCVPPVPVLGEIALTVGVDPALPA